MSKFPGELNVGDVDVVVVGCRNVVLLALV